MRGARACDEREFESLCVASRRDEQLVPSSGESALVYSEKKDDKLRQGRDVKLTFAAATSKERDVWIADLLKNKLASHAMVPLPEPGAAGGRASSASAAE